MPAATSARTRHHLALRASAAATAAAAASAKLQAETGRPVSAHDVLTAAGDSIAQGSNQRDASGDRSMRATVAAFNAIEGTQISVRQGWQLLALFKMTHAAASDQNGQFNPKHALDAAAYAALAGEEAAAAAGMTVQQ